MFLNPVKGVLRNIYEQKIGLGARFADEAGLTPGGKRQSLLEKRIYELLVQESAALWMDAFDICVENYPPISKPRTRYTMYVDPVDGTANTARWVSCGARQIGAAVATVLAIAPKKENLKFGDFTLGAGLDLRDGEYWIASKGEGAWTGTTYLARDTRAVVPKKQYHRHSPLLGSEFYRHINWAARLLVNQAVEWADTASSFVNMLRVPLGETDCFFNNLLPEVSQEGQRGHELGAISVFIKELQGCALDTRTMKPLATSLFTFDSMTPVIIAVDKTTALYYWRMIQKNLNKRVRFAPGRALTVRQAIQLLHKAVGVQPWSLRPLPKEG